MTKRVIVYFDWQNCFKSAVDRFPRGCTGTFDPLKAATRLATKPPPGAAPDREFTKAKIYRGLPNARKDPRTNAAAQKQHSRWESGPHASKIELHTRPLAYRPETFLDSEGAEIVRIIGHEKGVDVELAIDLVRDLLFEPAACDVAVVFSEDTDFYPAYELIVRTLGKDAVELARWHDRDGYAPDAPVINGIKLRQHLLDHAFFRSVEDKTAY